MGKKHSKNQSINEMNLIAYNILSGNDIETCIKQSYTIINDSMESKKIKVAFCQFTFMQIEEYKKTGNKLLINALPNMFSRCSIITTEL